MILSAEEKRAKWAAYMRAYNAKNPDINREKCKAYYYRNREERLRKQAEINVRSQERIKRYRVEYRRTPEGRARRTAAENKRRSLKANSLVKATAKDVALLMTDTPNCHYCELTFSEQMRPTLEHRVPLSRGGSHDLSNLTVACSLCNSRKGTKTDAEFIASLAVRS